MASLTGLNELLAHLHRRREPDDENDISQGDAKRIKTDIDKVKEEPCDQNASLASTEPPAITPLRGLQPSTPVNHDNIDLNNRTETTIRRILTFLHGWASKNGVSLNELQTSEINNAIRDVARSRGWQGVSRRNVNWLALHIRNQFELNRLFMRDPTAVSANRSEEPRRPAFAATALVQDQTTTQPSVSNQPIQTNNTLSASRSSQHTSVIGPQHLESNSVPLTRDAKLLKLLDLVETEDGLKTVARLIDEASKNAES